MKRLAAKILLGFGLAILWGFFAATPASAQVITGSGEFFTCYTPQAEGGQYTCQFFEQPLQCVQFQNGNTSITGAGFTPCQRSVGGATQELRDQLSARVASLNEDARRAQLNDDFGLDCGIGAGTGHVSHCFPLIGYYLFYVPSTWILALGGMVFDALTAFSLDSEIIGGQTFVETGWEVVLNISNLVFIFFLLYIAIQTVLGLGDWKKSVVPVIIVALLINFSLFFTKIIIDASNILAYQFYNNIGTPGTVVGTSSSGFEARNLSQSLVARVNPVSLTGITTYADWEARRDGIGGLFFVFLATAVIMIALAYVLFKAAFLMLGRLIAFWFLMMLSPLAFLGFAFPAAQKITGDWIRKLTDQALVAPVFLFFLYMISIILGSGLFEIQPVSASNSPTTQLLVEMILKTAVFIGLMMYALKTTTSLSGEFGSTVTKHLGGALGFVGGVAGGAALGGAAGLGRATLGRYAQRKVDSGNLQARAAQSGAAGWIARQQLAATKGVAGASMDIRTTKMGKELSKTLEKNLDLDLGEGKKGGFTAARDEQYKKDVEYAKSLEVGDNEKLGRAKTQAKADEVAAKQEKKRHDDTVKEREDDLKVKTEAYEKALSEYAKPENAANAVELKKKIDAAEQERNASQSFVDAAKAAQKAAEDTVKAAGSQVKAAENKITEENNTRRGAYANTVESRGSGAGYAVNLILNPSHSGTTSRDTANKIRTGTKPSYKSKGDSGKDSERIVSALEEVSKKLAEMQTPQAPSTPPQNPAS